MAETFHVSVGTYIPVKNKKNFNETVLFLFYFLRGWLVNNVLNIRSEKMHLILALLTLREESECST